MEHAGYIAEGVYVGQALVDLVTKTQGTRGVRIQRLWGRDGEARELALARQVPDDVLPVLLGSGLGLCLETLVERGPVVVVDREGPLLAISQLRKRFATHPNVLWLDDAPEQVLASLQSRSGEHGTRSLYPINFPLYLRLDHSYYKKIAQDIEALDSCVATDGGGGNGSNDTSAKTVSWARYPRFTSKKPRVILLRKKYFIYREIEAAFRKLSIPYAIVEIDENESVAADFMHDFLHTIARFRPDFVLTVNHFGMDREGRIAGVLEDAKIPLASWFVDSPWLVLGNACKAARSTVAVFSFDAASVDELRSLGFAHVFWLPLATDVDIFQPGATVLPQWESRVSFVGDTLMDRVAGYRAGVGNSELAKDLEHVAAGFAASSEHLPLEYLIVHHPAVAKRVQMLPSAENSLAAQCLLVFAASSTARIEKVTQLLASKPLVAGDTGWKRVLPEKGWRYHPYLDYYDELPGFYASAEVQFNCTSMQMKGAVNQRVFDVPACGAFVLTDHREQMEALLEPGREIAIYRNLEDISPEIERWLADVQGRKKMVLRARKRIVAEHTYTHRIASLVKSMRATFA